MKSWRGYFLLSIALIAVPIPALCQKTAAKAEPATGTVAGLVTCADTNAPARFAVVTLERVPGDPHVPEKQGDVGMNATATTDLEGHFVLEKVPVGRYFVVGILSGYLNPLGRFDHQDLAKMDEETQKELLKMVPVINVEADQEAQTSLRLEHASELNGTVLYDDGSPAIRLKIHLLHKDKSGAIVPMEEAMITGLGFLGGEVVTNDAGKFSLIGVPPGEYVICAGMSLQKVAVGGLLGGNGLSINVWGDEGGEVKIYSGSKFRLKEAKVTKVGEGEHLDGQDITIPLSGLHTVKGTVTAKRDGHALGKGEVKLLYVDDRTVAQSADVDLDGNFVMPYVPEDKYILQVTGGADVELAHRHEFNSNFTDEKVLQSYGDVELPLTVRADMSVVELAAPDAVAEKVAQE